MNSKPSIHVIPTKHDRILEWSCIILLLLIWFLSVWYYVLAPNLIPIHYGGDGTVNGWGNKGSVFLDPAIGTSLYLLLTVINRFPHYFNYVKTITPENAEEQYTNATRWVRRMKGGILLYITINLIDDIRTGNELNYSLNLVSQLAEVFLIIGPLGFVLSQIRSERKNQSRE